MKQKFKRGLSLIVVCAMLMALFPTAAFAADPGGGVPDAVTGGINGYMAGLTADGDTRNGYQTAFTGDSIPANAEQVTATDGQTYSPALNGKIWADKSVTANTTDGTFDVTLSALGQTFSSRETSQSEVAYDVMLVLDFSGSMTDDNKAANMVTAANTAIKTLMLDEGGNATNNRVGIVAYSGSSVTGNGIKEFFPLDHYTTSNQAGNYLEYYISNRSGYIRAVRTGNDNNPTYYVQNSSGQNVTENKQVTGGTPTQGGIYKAGELLKAGAANTTGVTDQNMARIPAIILLTDGQPGRATSAYKNLNGGETYSGSATSTDYPTYYENADDEVAAYTILTANAVKTDVAQTYWAKYSSQYQKMQGMTQNNVAKFYTIGLGITNNSWTNFVLNPGISDDAILTSTVNSGGSTTHASVVQGAKNILEADTTYGSNYAYSDRYEGGENLTAVTLTAIFQSFLDDIQTGGTVVDVGESTGNRNKMTFFETLGDGVRLNGTGTLVVPTYTISEDKQMAAGDTRTYTLGMFKLEGENYIELNDTDAIDWVENQNGTVYLRPTKVTVGEDGTEQDLDNTNEYDLAARDEFSFSVTALASTGQRQVQVSIPSKLMAYNVLSSSSAGGETTYDYYASAPVQVTYGVQAKSTTTAGEYLISTPGQSYLHFNPSSAQNEDDSYVMPYYWSGKGLNPGDSKDNPDNRTGSDSYVYRTVWGQNNDVSIYLGNNGRYTLTGKTLNFNLYWDDNSNVDAQRFESLQVQLYRREFENPNAKEPTAVPTDLVPVGEQVTLDLSNGSGTDADLWTRVWPDMPVYGEDGVYYRYWLEFPGMTDSNRRDYSASLYKENEGYCPEPGGAFPWFAFQTPGDGMLNQPESNLTVKLTREQEKVSYTITKAWDSAIGDTDIPDSIEIQLYANGQMVDENGDKVESQAPITLYKNPADGTEAWTATLSLPRNGPGGSAIQYTPLEVGDNTADFTVVTQYESIKDAAAGTITGYKATLTNYESVDKTSLTVVKTWDDANDQDGKRPDSLTFKLTATVDGKLLSDDELKELTGLDDLTQTMTKADSGLWPDVTWSKLPRTNTDNKAVTYSAVETKIGDANVTNNTTADYTVSYDYTVADYVFVTNTHTPKTVDITINKTWVDADNRDGLRPGDISGALYQQVGTGDITRVRSWSSQKTAAGADQGSISGLPKYSSGKPITYYVAESEVNGYELSVDGVTAQTAQDGTTVYPVTTGAITLINTHEAATLDYTVNFQWVDDDASQRPSTIQLKLAKRVGGVSSGNYTVTLSVVGGKITGVQSIVDKDNNVVTNEFTANIAQSTGEDGKAITTLSITGLPQYEGGELVTYTVGVTGSGDYDATMDEYTSTSNDFTLSYAPELMDLVLTKVWTNYPTEFRGTLDELGLTLKADGNVVNGEDNNPLKPDRAVINGGNWVFTWLGLPKNDAGTPITYSVEETNPPAANDTVKSTTQAVFVNGAAQLENVFDPNSAVNKVDVTVTKVWNDNENRNGLRPQVDSTEIEVRLYRKDDAGKTSVGTPDVQEGTNNRTWIYTWKDVPLYDDAGNAITYVAEEMTCPANYTPSVSSVEVSNGKVYTSLFNDLDGNAYSKGYLTIEKVWVDDGNKDGARPKIVTFYIGGQIEGGYITARLAKIQVTVDDDTVAAENLTNGENPPINVEKTTDGGFRFTIALPLYDASGKELLYYVDETSVAGYQSTYTNAEGEAVSGEVGKRVHLGTEGNPAAITVTNTHSSITYTVTYNANGGTGAVPEDRNSPYIPNAEATILGNTGGLERKGYTFLGWSTVQYPVVSTTVGYEAIKGNILNAGATLTVTGNTTLYAVWAIDTNGNDRPDYDETFVKLTFNWDDNNNQDGKRPNELSVKLEDGTTLTIGPGNVTTSSDGNTWTTVEQYLSTIAANGVTVAGYQVTISDDGTTATLTYTPGTTSFTATKIWGNMDSVPDDWSGIAATFVLYGNGKLVPNSQTEAAYTGAPETPVTWTGLPEYENGQEIVYHAYEEKVSLPGGDGGPNVTDHFQVSYNLTAPIPTITNKYLDGKTRAFTFVQEWDDSNNAAGMRPTAITVQLYDENNAEIGVPVTITADDSWGYTWEDLPLSKNGTDEANPQPTDYKQYYAEVEEMQYNAPAGFDVDGLYIPAGSVKFGNSYVNTQIDTLQINPAVMNRTITIQKVWAGDENVTGNRPAEVAIQLLAGGEVTDTIVLSGTGSTWTETVTVPKYQAFEEIAYSVREVEPSSKYVAATTYDADTDTFTVTNTLREDISSDAHTITFVYVNAYATDSAGAAIAENEVITVPAGGTYAFTAHANEGYILSGSATITDGATLTAAGADAYLVSNLTQNVIVTIKADKTDTGAHLSVTKTADRTSAKPGEIITWTIVVKNLGAEAMTDVVVTDRLTARGPLTVVDDGGADVSQDADGKTTFTIADLPTGATVRITVSYTVQPDDTGKIVNVAVTGDGEGDTSEVEVVIPTNPGLTVTKRLTAVNGLSYLGGSVLVGDTLTYTITVSNSGDTALSGVTVADQLPYGMALVSADFGYQYNGIDTVAWSGLSLPVGGSTVFTVTAYVQAAGQLTNAASATVPGGPSGGDSVTVWVTEPDAPPAVPAEPSKPALNIADHVAYIIGYEDGTVRPEKNITRAEVTTIFFRLLTDESRAYYWSTVNGYSDVSADAWYNNAVSTMNNAGIVTGYPDGSFRPDATITRAEFATIAARFSEVVYNGGNSFTDVPENHWAVRYIALAEYLGWINGYPDGTFRPDQAITRAEAMTLINRVLERAVDEDGLLPDMVTWSDNRPGTWYYEAVQEATNSHEYVRTGIQVPGQTFCYETWLVIRAVPDWASLERAWSTANSK